MDRPRRRSSSSSSARCRRAAVPDRGRARTGAGLPAGPAFLGRRVDWLTRSGRFGNGLLDYLAALRFTGDVHAMPEGTVFFADEPILRVTAPLPQAQLVETRLINIMHFQTLVASKAAR